MKSTIPREMDCTAEAPDPAGGLVTFCLWWGATSPPSVVGRTAEEAEQRLLDHLRRFFAEEAEEPDQDPDARARAELGPARAWGLSLHAAPSERAAFEVWHQVSMLTPEEALRRWRLAFPVSATPDPLEAAVADLYATRSGVASEAEPDGPPRRGYARLSDLARAFAAPAER